MTSLPRLVAAAGEHEPPVAHPARQEGRGETRLRQGETDAYVASVTMSVGGVDADVDRRVVGVRADPATDHSIIDGDGVDPAPDAMLRLTLVHRNVGLTERSRDKGPIQQVPGAYPSPPLRH